MKTVVINGSPRKEGDTVALLERYRQQMCGNIQQFNTYEDIIAPCRACGGCDRFCGCVMQDELQPLLTAIDAADVVILVSPIHFTELSGSLLSALSRLQCLWAARQKHGKALITDKPRHGIILLTAGSDGPFDKAIHTATVLLHQMGVSTIHTVISKQTDTLPAACDKTAENALLQVTDTIKKSAVG